MIQNPNAIGAAPAQGNPNSPQTPKLPPDAMAALRKDPQIAQAVAKYLGKPIPLSSVPDDMLVQIAGMVAKLGVDGAVKEFSSKVHPQIQAQVRAKYGGGAPAPVAQ